MGEWVNGRQPSDQWSAASGNRQNDIGVGDGDELRRLTSISSRNKFWYANGITLLVGHGFGCLAPNESGMKDGMKSIAKSIVTC